MRKTIKCDICENFTEFVVCDCCGEVLNLNGVVWNENL